MKKMIDKSVEQNMLHQEALAGVLGAIKIIIITILVFQLLVFLVEVAVLE